MALKNRTILLIGDSTQDVEVVAQALPTSDVGVRYELQRAANPESGIEILKNGIVDLVLLDVNLALSGTEDPIQQLREDFPHVPVIVLTNADDDELALKAASHGAQDYLVKTTINPHLLRRSIAYALERHHLLEKLERSSEERFREIIEKSADGMIVVNLEGEVCFTNPAVESIFERKATEIVGKRFDFHILARQGNVAPEPQSRMDDLSLKYVSLLAKTGKSTEMEISFDGDVVKLVEMRATDIQWAMKSSYLVVFHDITSLMRLQRLKAEIFERERISKLKDEFISTVSHELRTPLAIVKCAVENMKDGVTGPLSEKQEKIVRIASSNVDRLTKLIDDILDLSRLEAGTVKISKKLTALGSLVLENAKRFILLAREQGIEIETDIQQGLPEILVDPDKVIQVLDNLLGNALRYARKKIVIKVRTLENAMMGASPMAGEFMQFKSFVPRESDGIQVSVLDDGPGIDAEKLGQLFNKFVQIDRPTGGAGYKGTGLGLAISKEIVDLHNGKIWAESELGQGARFHFILPRVQEDANAEAGATLQS